MSSPMLVQFPASSCASNYGHSYCHIHTESSETQEVHYYANEELHFPSAPQTIRVSSMVQSDRAPPEHSPRRLRTKASKPQVKGGQVRYANRGSHSHNAFRTNVHVSSAVQCERAGSQQYMEISVKVQTGQLNGNSHQCCMNLMGSLCNHAL